MQFANCAAPAGAAKGATRKEDKGMKPLP